MSYDNDENLVVDTLEANLITADSFGGKGGGGAVIVASKIILGGYLIEAEDSGLFVTTRDGVKTKMELIDFRQTPIPATAPLQLAPKS